MNLKPIFTAGVAAVVVALASQANAAIVLQDDFTSGGQVANSLNWGGDSVFTSPSGPATGPTANNASTDLVGSTNPWGISSFDGIHNVVDLDGSTGGGNVPSGILQSTVSLASGDYTVTFWLSGNQRGGGPREATVSIGGQTWTSGSLASSAPWTLETVHFTNVAGPLTFEGLGPSNNVGDLLGDVTVSSGVPEASTWVMLGFGFAGLGFAGFRARRSPVAATL